MEKILHLTLLSFASTFSSHLSLQNIYDNKVTQNYMGKSGNEISQEMHTVLSSNLSSIQLNARVNISF